ncbi:MAG: hypothetical protein VX672_05170 [Planctomycetota bacterium]|nr:hypothetical protein [Planctomycetota bacterium]
MVRIEVVLRRIAMLGLLVPIGCSAQVGPRPDSVERASRVQALENENATLRIRLEDAERALAGFEENGFESSGHASLPRPIEIDTASGSVVRTGKDIDRLSWRLRTEDARGRFVQVVGPATVSAVGMDSEGRAVDLGRWTVNRATWRDSLREGLLGTAYALDLAMNARVPESAEVVLARVEISDPRLEEPLRLESEIPVLPDPETNR